jgi:hypothetical protein
MAACGGITMVFTRVGEAGPPRKMAITGTAIELAAIHNVENGHGIVSEPPLYDFSVITQVLA